MIRWGKIEEQTRSKGMYLVANPKPRHDDILWKEGQLNNNLLLEITQTSHKGLKDHINLIPAQTCWINKNKDSNYLQTKDQPFVTLQFFWLKSSHSFYAYILYPMILDWAYALRSNVRIDSKMNYSHKESLVQSWVKSSLTG